MNDETVQSTPPQSSNEFKVPPPAKERKSPLLLILVLLVLLVPIAAITGYKMSDQKAKKDIAVINNQLAVLQSNAHELPEGAFKVSDCIPNMGSHYLTPTSDPEYGPFYLVSKAGKVIGVEYMASEDMYTAIPETDPPVELITKDSPLFGWKFDHTEVSHMKEGHEGLLEDHVDVHYYTVNPEQQSQACI
ncbi:hypothetical protein H0V99_03530 [Candidatus Saccharibacteria bacterium]|nr:hypothetical protein [Candidatus Saccharibacteria bacterium]